MTNKDIFKALIYRNIVQPISWVIIQYQSLILLYEAKKYKKKYTIKNLKTTLDELNTKHQNVLAEKNSENFKENILSIKEEYDLTIARVSLYGERELAVIDYHKKFLNRVYYNNYLKFIEDCENIEASV